MKDGSLAAQLEPITRPIARFLWRFHVIIFSIFIIGGVAVSIFLFSGLLSAGSGDTSVNQRATFDKTTIETIENFESPDSSIDTFSLPSGRSNPFAE